MKMPATTKKAVTGTPNSADSTDLTIVTQNNEPRVDSRLLAQRLGIKHHSLFAQAKTYKADFKEFGKVLFQTEPSIVLAAVSFGSGTVIAYEMMIAMLRAGVLQ